MIVPVLPDSLPSCKPTCAARSRIASARGTAFPHRISSPGSAPRSIVGTSGTIRSPEFTKRYGIPVSCSAARVITAGVGAPFGFIGSSGTLLGLPYTTISESAAGVYTFCSVLAPAADIFGIRQVSVFESTQRKSGSVRQSLTVPVDVIQLHGICALFHDFT